MNIIELIPIIFVCFQVCNIYLINELYNEKNYLDDEYNYVPLTDELLEKKLQSLSNNNLTSAQKNAIASAQVYPNIHILKKQVMFEEIPNSIAKKYTQIILNIILLVLFINIDDEFKKYVLCLILILNITYVYFNYKMLCKVRNHLNFKSAFTEKQHKIDKKYFTIPILMTVIYFISLVSTIVTQFM